jgi:hypothetical protein
LNEKPKKRINCLKCENFYVTWEKKFPNGCRAYGFKTKHMPSMDVLSSSGVECQLFKEKAVKDKAVKDKA